MVHNANGSIIDNESFRATTSINQEAMGVSAYYNRDGEELVLLYNVSNSPTVDENRPHVARYRVIGTSLFYDVGFRIDDTFSVPSAGFNSNPNFTGLKILRNAAANTYVMFGMLDAYGQSDDQVLSVYQEFDMSGSLIGTAKYWNQSNIAMSAGFSNQGGAYSIHNSTTLNTDLYTPETTTLNIDSDKFVSILPNETATFAFDIISSTLNTAAADSPCIEDFELIMVNHNTPTGLCLDVFDATGVESAPNDSPILIFSLLDLTCEIFNSPAMGNSEIELEKANENSINALILFRELNQRNRMAQSYLTLSRVNNKKDEFNVAIEYLDSAISIFQVSGNIPEMNNANLVKAEIFYRQKKYKKAISLAKKVEENPAALVYNVDSVKSSIDEWLQGVDSTQRDRFSKLLFCIEEKGILLPDIENVVRWGAQQLPR